MKLFIATSNSGKLRDFAYAASAYPSVSLEPLPGMARVTTPEETADTFAGNALIKALAYAALAPSEIVLADDSGIEVPALGCVPGVRSARFAEDERFAGTGSTDERNTACLLDRAASLAGAERAARYRCVLVAVRGGQVLFTAEGELDGLLLREPRGTSGFGYDPVFYLPEPGLTMAEVDAETRLRLSHRGRALRALLTRMNAG